MSTHHHTLTLEDREFQVSRLKVKDSLKGLRLVGKVLLPAVAEASSAPSGQIGDAISKVVEGLDCLPELLDLFAAATKVKSATGSFMALAPVLDDTFGGRPDLVVEFLVECVKTEFGAFLSGSGRFAGLLQLATAKAAATPV